MCFAEISEAKLLWNKDSFLQIKNKDAFKICAVKKLSVIKEIRIFIQRCQYDVITFQDNVG